VPNWYANQTPQKVLKIYDSRTVAMEAGTGEEVRKSIPIEIFSLEN